METMYWIHEPKQHSYKDGVLTLITEPNTDYWQRTHYNFIHDNAPTYVKDVVGDFTFTVKAKFDSHALYDQAGIIIYQNSENWIKASSEYHTPEYSTLGSVVTNNGYSDWAFQNISSQVKELYYRLSRKGQDFLLEFSQDGKTFTRMRIAHMKDKIEVARVGIYACSPLDSSFKAEFSEFLYEDNKWIDE